jgi:alpha-galactosidase
VIASVPPAALVQLSAAGVSIVLEIDGEGLPRVRHFGADYGPPGAFPPPPKASPRLLAGQADGWHGRPGLAGYRLGGSVPVRWALDGGASGVDVQEDEAGGTITVSAVDDLAGLRLLTELHLDRHGALRMRHTLTNTAPASSHGDYVLADLRCAVPVPATATEVLDFTGRWGKEKIPQRHPLRHGAWSRESRRGRTGHDATGLLAVGVEGFGFRRGAVWGVHAGWSGDHVHTVESWAEGTVLLSAGELLAPGEIQLGEGESYRTPWVYFTYAADGLDHASARLHGHLRDRAQRSRGTRPVTLNNWEATYFDHGIDRLLALATRAAEVGIERFVLDDGWFRHRRHDRAGLGDWYVDEGVWPDGLHPLATRVRALGMQFGLWFEPEMVNPDSDLAREHPGWILGQPGRWPNEHRQQQTLDLANDDAYAFLLKRIDSLVTEYDLSYIKWDHNRDIAEPVHDGRLGVHRQTEAAYRLIDELRSRHPGLEIESCSSGGGRIDYGILVRTDRVWTSDCNDALERQSIQRWTGLLVPPEMMGAHVGAPNDHTTGRSLSLAFRCLTALFGHMGVEWDITSASDAERAELAEWIATHKRLRHLIHGGTVVRADHPDPSSYVHGVVTADRSEAVYAYARLTTPAEMTPAAIRLPGLDPAATYGVTMAGTEYRMSGAMLDQIGLPVPHLATANGVLIEVTRA